MDTRYGKLILLNPDGPVQEYELAKKNILIGRGTTNDITLEDVRVSRSHARLDFTEGGITITDLGSSNGTHINGVRVEHATLVPGDTISLGSQELKYLVEDLSEDVGLTAIDTQLQLDQTIDNEFLPVVINDTNSPSLVVFTGEKTWRYDLRDRDQVTIGRDESCALFIDSTKVSRRHAEVQHRGETFLLNDLGSTNGTRVNSQQIDQHILQDCDVIQVGDTQIIFKRGFQEQALTLVEEQFPVAAGRRTVVFVPGLMGSELWLGDERVWPNVKTLFTNPELYVYPSKIPLEPRNIVDEVVIVPNLIKVDQYNRLGDYFVDELHFNRGVDFFEFPYDWRQDVRTSAAQLGELVESLPTDQPIVIIGHSLGTMVTRYYVECLGGDERIERMILMGGPHKGVVKVLISFLVGPDVVPFGIMGERLRKILMTFPSSYQILPIYPLGSDQHGDKINFLEDENWLDPQYIALQKLGREFRNELHRSAGKVPTISIFGYGISTVSDVSLSRVAGGKIETIEFLRNDIGDGSVLERSAFLPGSEIHPVHQHHGELFVDNDVKMRLKVELLRPY